MRLTLFIATVFTAFAPTLQANPLVDAADYLPSAIFDIRYYTEKNFVGEPINGYQAPKCLLTRPAAKALQQVQQEVAEQGLTLKIFDCYRPQRAVDHFVRWTDDLDDTRMQAIHYPVLAKQHLFQLGYIAAKSGHSRGSTVDLALVSVAKDGKTHRLDMGTPFDFFDPLSHTDNPHFTGTVADNRQQLKQVMTQHGFKNLPEEWWHYTLEDEPYPDTYFDYPVR